MQEYRGIKVADSVKLFNKDGSYNTKVKKSLDILVDKVQKENHKICSEYVGVNKKILLDFACGHEPHWITPYIYKSGSGCPKCCGNCPEQAKEELLKLVVKNGHTLMSEYVNNKEKILINFNCGHEPHWIAPSAYKSGSGCPKCCGHCSEQAKEDFLNLLKKNGHELMSNYTNNRTKILINFNCGHEPHWIAPHMYKSGQGCPKCGKSKVNKRKILEAKNDFLKILQNNGHVLLGEYVSSITKTLIDFNCGHEPHWITPYIYKSGSGCPQCKESKGEKIIREWLEKNDIDYKSQYKLPNSKKRYDLFLPEYNLIIEVHGKQHYEEVDFFSNRTLQEERENDKLKEEHARSLGYNYMVVDYREHNPELVLERFKNQFLEFKEKI